MIQNLAFDENVLNDQRQSSNVDRSDMSDEELNPDHEVIKTSLFKLKRLC